MRTKDVIVAIIALLLVEFILLTIALSFAVRIKKGVLIKQLIIGKIIKLINKGSKLKGYPVKGIIIILGILLVNLFLTLMDSPRINYSYIFPLLVFDSLVFAGMFFALFQMNRLINFAKNMANGDLETKLDTENIYYQLC